MENKNFISLIAFILVVIYGIHVFTTPDAPPKDCIYLKCSQKVIGKGDEFIVTKVVKDTVFADYTENIELDTLHSQIK